MKRTQLDFRKGFRVPLCNRRGNVAAMVIPPGDREGGPANRHHGADQWLFVVGGQGTARINGKPYPLRAGSLMLIEAGDRHEIRNTGRRLLKTLNFYTPPAYRRDGEPLPRARRSPRAGSRA